MLALEWAAESPLPVHAVVVIAAPPQHSAWAIGLAAAQRAAIRADPAWCQGQYAAECPPRQGLAAARMIAMCSYRGPESFSRRFHRSMRPKEREQEREGEGEGEEEEVFQVESYLLHHGQKLGDRFDANSYMHISAAMDGHDVSRGRGSLQDVLAAIQLPALVLGIASDVLYVCVCLSVYLV
jgi:homoserine O-acetyltransferase